MSLYKGTTLVAGGTGNYTREQLKELIQEEVSNQLQEAVDAKILADNQQKYHVGKIIVDVSNTNPSTYLGFGTWELFAQGKTLVGVDTSQTEFNKVLKTGGEKTHTQTVQELASHWHYICNNWSSEYRFLVNAATGSGNNYVIQYKGGGNESAVPYVIAENQGGGQPMNNLQPYITVYFWRRTA